MKATLIGNGTSRLGFDLNKLNGVTLGCNDLYKTYEPTYLIGMDIAQVISIQQFLKQNGPQSWKFVTRAFDNDPLVPVCWVFEDGKKVVKRKEINGGYINNSGILAAAYAVEVLDVTELYMIGIDFYREVPGKDNGIIHGNHISGRPMVETWNHLVRRNPHARFVRVGPIAEKDKDYFYKKLVGFEYISYEEFLEDDDIFKS